MLLTLRVIQSEPSAVAFGIGPPLFERMSKSHFDSGIWQLRQAILYFSPVIFQVHVVGGLLMKAERSSQDSLVGQAFQPVILLCPPAKTTGWKACPTNRTVRALPDWHAKELVSSAIQPGKQG